MSKINCNRYDNLLVKFWNWLTIVNEHIRSGLHLLLETLDLVSRWGKNWLQKLWNTNINEIDLSVEQKSYRSRSTHMVCLGGCDIPPIHHKLQALMTPFNSKTSSLKCHYCQVFVHGKVKYATFVQQCSNNFTSCPLWYILRCWLK